MLEKSVCDDVTHKAQFLKLYARLKSGQNSVVDGQNVGFPS
jgi:hypothetical protein